MFRLGGQNFWDWLASRGLKGGGNVRMTNSAARRNVKGRRMGAEQTLTHLEHLGSLIHLIHGQRVMLDSDLARLYSVHTKDLNKAVGRNRSRFPADFMFQLDGEEVKDLRFQLGTSSSGYGG